MSKFERYENRGGARESLSQGMKIIATALEAAIQGGELDAEEDHILAIGRTGWSRMAVMHSSPEDAAEMLISFFETEAGSLVEEVILQIKMKQVIDSLKPDRSDCENCDMKEECDRLNDLLGNQKCPGNN
jgi:hypothetical protein